MNAPADPPTAAAAPKPPNPERRWLRLPAISRRVGCLAVWLLFLTPAAYSLMMARFPELRDDLMERLSPPFGPPSLLARWLDPGPARSLSQWLANIEPGPTMVYLIFAAVLVLFSVGVFVREEPRAGE